MRKITGNKKGIDTILAALLMVVIVVVAAVMVYAWSTGLLGTLLVNPNNNREGPLYADNSAVCSAANCNYVTINIRNAGSLAVTLNSYYISDSSNNQWSNTAYNNSTAAGTINPNSVVVFTFKIGTSNNCAYSGTQGSNPFFNGGAGGFPSGQYTVKVVTARNNPFSFTVSK